MVCIIIDNLDLKNYISSGIIESYVLGVVSDQERKEVECMSHIYPEIREQLLIAQSDLETLSKTWAKNPPADLKGRVMAAIQEEIKNEPKPVSTEAKTIEMKPSPVPTQWRNIAAVALVAALTFGGFYFKTNSSLSETESILAETKDRTNQLDNQLLALQSEIQQYDSEKNFLLHEATVQVALTGTAISPDSKMKIYWNASEKKIVMASTKLPQTGSDLQYQLWAIVDGKSVDLGVFDLLKDKEIAAKNIDVGKVQAFAVTLEKKGGSAVPNLKQLYVIGNV